MKTRSTSILVLIAALSTAVVIPLAAAPSDSTPAMVYAIGAVKGDGAKVIRLGDSATKVTNCLGLPDQKLFGGDTWVYRRFQCQRELENAEVCTTLLIVFNHGRVSDLMRVNDPAVQVLAAKLTVPVAPHWIVAGK